MAEVDDAATQLGTIEITINGGTHKLDTAKLGANDASAVRSALGMPLRKLLEGLGDPDEVDVDIVAGLVWLARRQGGEHNLPYKAVAATIGYKSVQEMSAANLDDPEALPAADPDNDPDSEGLTAGN